MPKFLQILRFRHAFLSAREVTLSSTPDRLLSSRTAWPWDECLSLLRCLLCIQMIGICVFRASHRDSDTMVLSCYKLRLPHQLATPLDRALCHTDVQSTQLVTSFRLFQSLWVGPASTYESFALHGDLLCFLLSCAGPRSGLDLDIQAGPGSGLAVVSDAGIDSSIPPRFHDIVARIGCRDLFRFHLANLPLILVWTLSRSY